MNRIRQLREDQGWSQAELARRIGCSRSLISMIETDQTLPTLRTLQKMAQEFNVSVASILPEPEPSPSRQSSAAQ